MWTSLVKMTLRTYPSQKTLRELFHYDGRSGLLTWRETRGRFVKPGDEAGTVRPDGMVTITIKGRPYLAHRLIWIYVHGRLPDGRLKFADRDPGNLRLGNIVPEAEMLSPAYSATYQRQRRIRLQDREEQERIAAEWEYPPGNFIDPALDAERAATEAERTTDARARVNATRRRRRAHA